MRRIPPLVWQVLGLLIVALVLSFIWSSSYPPVPQEPDRPSKQVDRLIQVSGAVLAASVGLLAAVTIFSYRKPFRERYKQAVVFCGIAFVLSVFFFAKLAFEPLLEEYLPLSLPGFRFNLLAQTVFLAAGVISAVALFFGKK